MKIRKTGYTKPLPPQAKILKRKDGKWAVFTNARGQQKKVRLTKQGDRILVESKHWSILFADNLGVPRMVKAFTDRAATRRLADRIQCLLNAQASGGPVDGDTQEFVERLPRAIRGTLAECGLLDGRIAEASRPLEELITEFGEHLRADKERSVKYVAGAVAILRRTFDACGFHVWGDIRPEVLIRHLRELRDGGRGISKRTYNGNLKTVQQFCKWAVESGYFATSPVAYVKGLENMETDRRYCRRAATDKELRRLLHATLQAQTRFGMDGEERSLLYWFAASTGLRGNEIRTLTVASFDLRNLMEASVTVTAAFSKHRCDDIVPLRPELGAALQAFFERRKRTGSMKAFGGSYVALTDRTADMLRADLAEAQISHKDEKGRAFDFHAFRHTFITNLRRAPLRVQQALARHKSSAMTDRYSHAYDSEMRSALDLLPDVASGDVRPLAESLPKAYFSSRLIEST